MIIHNSKSAVAASMFIVTLSMLAWDSAQRAQKNLRSEPSVARGSRPRSWVFLCNALGVDPLDLDVWIKSSRAPLRTGNSELRTVEIFAPKNEESNSLRALRAIAYMHHFTVITKNHQSVWHRDRQ